MEPCAHTHMCTRSCALVVLAPLTFLKTNVKAVTLFLKQRSTRVVVFKTNSLMVAWRQCFFEKEMQANRMSPSSGALGRAMATLSTKFER